MSKYIIKQIPPEQAELGFYFDGDTFTERAGGIEYALFVLVAGRWSLDPIRHCAELWKRITKEAANLAEAFYDVENNCSWNGYTTYKEAMRWEAPEIKYSPATCHRLKEWAQTAEEGQPESIAAYLTIKTGKPWTTASASGYSQGDYCEIVYCEDIYSQEDAEAAGEIALGAANEYSITFPAEDGSEPETVYGYIIADCQAWRAEDVKRLICKWEGIDPAEAVLLTISGSHTYTSYEWEEVC